MDWHEHVRRHLPPTGLDPAREADIVEEFAQQFEQTFEEARAGGLTEDAARRQAEATIGDWSALAREIVEAERSKAARAARAVAAPLLVEPEARGRAGALLAALWHDARYGLRLLARHRAFAATTVLTLAVTIGATTAIFSLVNVVLLKPLSFEDSGRLVDLTESAPEIGFAQIPFSPPDLMDFVAAQRSFSGVAPYRNARIEFAGEEASERVTIAKVSASLFDVLAVRPLHGRVFRADEDAPGHDVAILSHPFWARRFASDPGIVGQTVLLDRSPFTVVGVMPAHAGFPLAGQRFNAEPAALFIPIAFTPEELAARGGMFTNSVVARLAPGVTLERARAEATVLAGRIQAEYSPELMAVLGDTKLGVRVSPLADEVAALSRPLLLVLFAAVLLLVVAGSANVGNLMLTLAAGRRREFAVRAAVGAGAGRLLRQLVAESTLIAAIGGLLGLALAYALVDLAPSVVPGVTPRIGELSVDGRVLAFAAVVTVFTALVFGMAPGLQAARSNASSALADAARGSTGGAGGRTRNGLVVLQCALAMLLLVVAGLLGRSLYALVSTDPGFETRRALIVSTYLPQGGYGTGPDVRRFYDDAVERLRALPGVVDAGASMDQPLLPGERRAMMPEGIEVGATGPPVVVHSWITAGYLETIGVPLVRGRFFDVTDRLDGAPAMVVSESAARQFWPGEDPVGRRVRWSDESPWMTVVGVVGDIHEVGLAMAPQPHTYAPIAQVDDPLLAENVIGMFRGPSVVVAASGDPRLLGGLVRTALQDIDPRLSLTPPQALSESVAGSLAPQRFAAIVVGAFAVAALLLAGLGLHGVLAYGVRQRYREIGIRVALGASRAAVVGSVVRRGLTLTGVGLVVGLGGAFAVTRALASVLTGVTATDPLTFAGMALVLLGVTLVATWQPSMAAVRVDPASAIRDE